MRESPYIFSGQHASPIGARRPDPLPPRATSLLGCSLRLPCLEGATGVRYDAPRSVIIGNALEEKLQGKEEILADAVQRAVTEQLKILLWGVYDRDRYAVHELAGGEGDTDLYVVYDRPHSEESVGHVRRYAPFVETPHLFLMFARLADEEITRDRWVDWTRRYGVLGLQRPDPRLKHGAGREDRRRPSPLSRRRPARPTKR